MNIPDRLLFKCNEPPLSTLAEALLAERWSDVAKTESEPGLPKVNAETATREQTVREGVAQGLSMSEIAAQLGVSTSNVWNICKRHSLLTCWVVQRWDGQKWLYVCEARTRKEAIDKYTGRMLNWEKERRTGKVRCIRTHEVK